MRKRLEALRQDVKRTNTVTLELCDQAKEDFDACQVLASGKARQPLSPSQTTWVLARFYRDALDPREKREGTRRMGPTIEQPAKRGVPAAVVRKIWERSGGLCEFGLCDRSATEFCHVKDHRGWRRGNPSGRETGDLVHGCHLHHTLFDEGEIVFLAWSTDAGRFSGTGRASGRPVFRVERDGTLLVPKPWPEDREKEASPEWLLRGVGQWDTKEARAARKRAREEEEEARRKKILDEASPSPPPQPRDHASGETAGEVGPDSTPADEDPPPKPEAPDGSGLVHDRGPPYGAPGKAARTPRRIALPFAHMTVSRFSIVPGPRPRRRRADRLPG